MLTKHRYLRGPYRKDAKLTPAAVKQTKKGVVRSAQHAAEKKPLNRGIKGNHATKYARFAKMMKKLAPHIT